MLAVPLAPSLRVWQPVLARAGRGLVPAGLLAGAGFLGVAALLVGTSAWVTLASRGHLCSWEEVAAGPPAWDPAAGRPGSTDEPRPPRSDGEVEIVLGAAVRPGGVPSPWLGYRLEVAAGLYLAGLVDAVVVSGDGSRAWRDEPAVMRDHLVRLGIPEPAIVLDAAGMDTYDTCVRARRVLGVERAVLVSQDFHLPRAVTIARVVGLRARGVGDVLARRLGPWRWRRSWLRERPAAVKALWDASAVVTRCWSHPVMTSSGPWRGRAGSGSEPAHGGERPGRTPPTDLALTLTEC